MTATTLAIIADTHLPRGQRHLPASCTERLEAADQIIHAGDIRTRAALDQIAELGDLHAVHGNVDDDELRALLPEQVELTIDGVVINVVHDAGFARGRLTRLRSRFPRADAVIFGHSHIPLHEQDEMGAFTIFNPGSPTDRRRQPHFTMGWAEISRGRISIELVELAPD